MTTEEFIDDFMALSYEEMAEKYKLVFSSEISSLVAELKGRQGGLELLLSEWPSDLGRDESARVCLNLDKYEVFSVERGGRHAVESHPNLDEAAFDFFDRYLNSLLCTAPDSRINAGYPESEYLKKMREEKLSRSQAQEKKLLDDIRTADYSELDRKYSGRLAGIRIVDLMDLAKSSAGGLKQFVSEWRGDESDPDFYFLIRSGERFEVFGNSGRGGKAALRVHATIDEAVFDYLDRVLNSLRYLAPDSKILKRSQEPQGR